MAPRSIFEPSSVGSWIQTAITVALFFFGMTIRVFDPCLASLRANIETGQRAVKQTRDETEKCFPCRQSLLYYGKGPGSKASNCTDVRQGLSALFSFR
jgi:hypothetical protein